MKRFLILPVIVAQAFYVPMALANRVPNQVDGIMDEVTSGIDALNEKLQALCDDEKIVNLEETEKSSNRVWKEIAKQVKNARVKYKIYDDIKLGDRTTLRVGNETISETSIGGKYSGIDKWVATVSASGAPFQNSGIGLSLSTTRDFTFIQQFPTRCKSIARLGYNPITKLPTSSEKALKALKPGDFVAFSAPLVISLGKSVAKYTDGAKAIGAAVGASIYAAGEIDIHVFRMNDNHVRVRFFASKSRGASLSISARLIGISSLASKFLDLTPAEFAYTKSSTNLFSSDYVFNLNDEVAKSQYDQIMGRKFRLTDFPVTGVNPFASDNSMKEALFADLESVDAIAQADATQPEGSRRIVRLAKGDTHTVSDTTTFRANLGFVKAKNTSTYSDTDVSLFNVNNENSKYRIKSISKLFSYDFFKYWGQDDSFNTAFLLDADNKYEPVSAKGLQTVRIKEELAFSRNEISKLEARLRKLLPAKIFAELKFPDVNKLKETVSNGRIEQSLYIDSQVMETKVGITKELVHEKLLAIINNWGKIDSRPINTDGAQRDSIEGKRLESKNSGDAAFSRGQNGSAKYIDAFEQEIREIPQLVENLFNANIKPVSQKLVVYEHLQNKPLFNEIGTQLLLSLIPNNLLDEAVIYKMVITGRGIEAKTSEYPVNADMTSLNIYNRILNESAFFSDRSFNLRYYLNEKAEPLSLAEVIKKSE
jgi:hypothetical protein